MGNCALGKVHSIQVGPLYTGGDRQREQQQTDPVYLVTKRAFYVAQTRSHRLTTEKYFLKLMQVVEIEFFFTLGSPLFIQAWR
jgi:hypothetical protein